MIRQATAKDAEQALALLYSAIGSIAYSLAGTNDHEQAMETLKHFFGSRENRISYENTIVDDRGGQLAGLLVAYDGSRAERLDEPLLERIRVKPGQAGYTIVKEAQEGEYYLDSLAVDEAFQGQGVAKALMRAFEAKGKADGFPRLSLIVEEENERAYGLYEKMGYREDGLLEVSGSLFRRMIKTI
ncbi:GNAT family N-acetyltransferase [Paenibacillus hodogayensis]|uniref:GNAT family N-acetyltransferase n=1 Tax=Paenibacillus hodogayensis TaxID=279208 RepID=A0ABV5W370_9BACL